MELIKIMKFASIMTAKPFYNGEPMNKSGPDVIPVRKLLILERFAIRLSTLILILVLLIVLVITSYLGF